MHTLLTSFKGIHNIGLFCFVNDKIGLVGEEVPTKLLKEFEEVFEVPFHKLTIAGTSLLGSFLVGIGEKLLIPSITFDYEKKELERLGVDFEVFETNLTCLGNNIVSSESGVIINPEFTEAEREKLEQLFKVPVTRKKFADSNAVGNVVVINKNLSKGLVSNEVTEEEYEELQTLLGADLMPGSVNMGSSYVRSGIVVNKNGFAIGEISGGPEITNAEEALGFVEY